MKCGKHNKLRKNMESIPQEENCFSVCVALGKIKRGSV
jgi:hypothetical protein